MIIDIHAHGCIGKGDINLGEQRILKAMEKYGIDNFTELRVKCEADSRNEKNKNETVNSLIVNR